MHKEPKGKGNMHEKLKGNTSDHVLQSIDCQFTGPEGSQPFSVAGGTWNLMDRCLPHNNAWGVTEQDDQYRARKIEQINEIGNFFVDGDKDFLFVQEADLFFGENNKTFEARLKEVNDNLAIVRFPANDPNNPNKKIAIIYDKNKLVPNQQPQTTFDDCGFYQLFLHLGSNTYINLSNVHLDFKPERSYDVNQIQQHLTQYEAIPTIMGGDTNHPVGAFIDTRTGQSIALGDRGKITNIAQKKDPKTKKNLGIFATDERYSNTPKSYDNFFVYAGENNTCVARVEGKGFETNDKGKTYQVSKTSTTVYAHGEGDTLRVGRTPVNKLTKGMLKYFNTPAVNNDFKASGLDEGALEQALVNLVESNTEQRVFSTLVDMFVFNKHPDLIAIFSAKFLAELLKVADKNDPKAVANCLVVCVQKTLKKDLTKPVDSGEAPKTFEDFFKQGKEPSKDLWLRDGDIDTILYNILDCESKLPREKKRSGHVITDDKRLFNTLGGNTTKQSERAKVGADLFKYYIDRVLKEEGNKYPLTLYAPFNIGNHFVYIKAEISDPKGTDKKIKITYKDSMNDPGQTIQDTLRDALQFNDHGYKTDFDFQHTGKQHNSHSCADYAMQEILSELKPGHPIATEKNTEHLRDHVVMELEKIEFEKIKDSTSKKYQDYQLKHKNIAFKHKIENSYNPASSKSGIKTVNTTQADAKGVLSKITYQDDAEFQIKKTANTCEVSTKNHTAQDFERLIDIAIKAGATAVEVSGPHADKIRQLCVAKDLEVTNKPEEPKPTAPRPR